MPWVELMPGVYMGIPKRARKDWIPKRVPRRITGRHVMWRLPY